MHLWTIAQRTRALVHDSIGGPVEDELIAILRIDPAVAVPIREVIVIRGP